MKTVLSAYIPHTNVELELVSDGKNVFMSMHNTALEKCCPVSDEKGYVKGVADILEKFTEFKVNRKY